jgi:hypothetical protein
MESAPNTLKIYLGEFYVVEVAKGRLTLDVGKNVHITIYLGDYDHTIKTGQKLPLYTEIPHANVRPTSVQ